MAGKRITTTVAAVTAGTVRADLLGQLDEVRRMLSRRALDEDDVHGARKTLKRGRAMLRLLRPALPKAAFRRENLALRDAGRALAGARDAKVLADALDRMLEEGAFERAAFETLARALAAERTAANDAAGGLARAAAEARAAVRTSRTRLAGTRLRADGREPLTAGLAAIYRRGQAAFVLARGTPTAETLHEWRKQGKNYWHAAECMAPVWPRYFAAVARDAHKLADRLGDDHDLALLAERIAGGALPAPAADALCNRIAAARADLQDRAFALGAALYGARPRQLVRLLQAERTPAIA